MYAFLSKFLNRVFAIIWLIFYIQNLALKQILLMAMSSTAIIFQYSIASIYLLRSKILGIISPKWAVEGGEK